MGSARRRSLPSAARSITPLDAVLGALLRERSGELIAGCDRKFAILGELLTRCPEAGQVPEDRVVDLS